jgi:alkyl sulfatase BDS1-like metallo-beta-lactamase superfamily hydrolase
MDNERQPASAATVAHQQHVAANIDLADPRDEARARRGFLAGPLAPSITGRFDHAVWDFHAYDFECSKVAPDSVNPSLWRQARLNNIAGLFEVVDGIYQVRGFDISNITFIRGNDGWIVLDPLTSAETARAAYELVTATLGERPISAVIYSHSHVDHYGGVRGILSDAQCADSSFPIIAPAGFLHEAVSENVTAGTVMLRRAMYMYGALLPRDEFGHVDTGLGKGIPALPTVSLVAPTVSITETGQVLTIDGVDMEFQLTPGSEAPAEMHLYLPQWRALCVPENCTATLHNLYTLRGAQVRDALAWSGYINETIERYGERSDVLFASHHWPHVGDEIVEYLADQRDLSRYLHDATMRLANHGYVMDEIADMVSLPPQLSSVFANRDYYGTVHHNVRAIYNRYLGFFDGNPAHLAPLPPVEAGSRYVAAIGGSARVLEAAREAMAAGDYRWAVELVNHLVFSDPENEEARLVQASALEQLGYQSESGPWRDFYLTGAMELRSNGTFLRDMTGNAMQPDVVAALSGEMLRDLWAVRTDTHRALTCTGVIDFVLSDGPTMRLGLRGGVVYAPHAGEPTTATVTTTRAVLADLATGTRTESDDLDVTGDRELVRTWCAAGDRFGYGFDIVLPHRNSGR